ncbi:MAG: cytochrome c, partial [Bacteroidota bacterium]
CHMDEGTGLQGIIPPLAGADFLTIRKDELPCIIRKGLKGEITVNGKKYSTEMPGSPALTEFEITNVINYINHAWGNDFGVVKHETVREALKKCEVYEEMLK